jgi:flavin-dependent dehydrogenase
MVRTTDIAILGAGPAGSAAGILLRRHAPHLRVMLLEKERHPRHHVGESLLPASLPILEELGFPARMMAERYQPKYGARFYDPPTDRLVTFGFEPAPGSISPSFQVLREDFDALMLSQALSTGCEVLQNAAIERVDEAAGSLHLCNGDEVRARFIIDATGRDALIASKRKERRILTEYGRVGIYNYFEHLPPHDELDPQYITMYLFDTPANAGWVWLIPLREGLTSVGVVYRMAPSQNLLPEAASRPEALFRHAVNSIPRLQSRLQAARPRDVYRAISDYSFTVDHMFDPAPLPRWAAIGDAAGFLDPIFSSGVHLALCSAHTAVPAIIDAISTGSTRGLQAYAAHMENGFQVFRAFVRRFYNRDLVQNLFFMENKPPELHAAITRILAGHVWDHSNPILKLLGIHRPA